MIWFQFFIVGAILWPGLLILHKLLLSEFRYFTKNCSVKFGKIPNLYPIMGKNHTISSGSLTIKLHSQ